MTDKNKMFEYNKGTHFVNKIKSVFLNYEQMHKKLSSLQGFDNFKTSVF